MNIANIVIQNQVREVTRDNKDIRKRLGELDVLLAE
jgi:hypothetical protein